MLPAEENPDERCRERMSAPQRKTPSGTLENTRAERTHGECGTGIIAEYKKMLRLSAVDGAAPPKRGDARRAERVPAGQTEQKYRRPRAAHAEQTAGERRETPCKRVDRAEPGKKSRRGKVWQQRRDENAAPEPQPLCCAFACTAGGKEKESKKRRARGVTPIAFFHGTNLCTRRGVHAAWTPLHAHRMAGEEAML